jgi:hypothetical protein
MGISTSLTTPINDYEKIKGFTVVRITEDNKTRLIENIVLEKDGKKVYNSSIQGRTGKLHIANRKLTMRQLIRLLGLNCQTDLNL